MKSERIPGSDSGTSLKQWVETFAELEGRQPRAMVCRTKALNVNENLKEISVDLASYGFDVDIGIPFDSVDKLGISAIENDTDILVLFGLKAESDQEYVRRLETYFVNTGYSHILILFQYQYFSPGYLQDVLIDWLKSTLK